MKFDPEFKQALQFLPATEKDKLILRLLRHDLKLANKLRFELVDTDSVEDKRAELEQKIIKTTQRATERFYSSANLLTDMREISGTITEHVYTTKDKFGEISLNSIMLRQFMQMNNPRIDTDSYGNAYKLCIYIVSKIFKLLMLIQKQHEDLHLEFQEDIETIGQLIGNNHHLMKIAINHGLDVNWLIHFEIPSNINDIYKDLKANGYLK